MPRIRKASLTSKKGQETKRKRKYLHEYLNPSKRTKRRNVQTKQFNKITHSLEPSPLKINSSKRKRTEFNELCSRDAVGHSQITENVLTSNNCCMQ